jgi:hypothetical protein
MVKRSAKIINNKNLNPKGVINDLNGGGYPITENIYVIDNLPPPLIMTFDWIQ